MEIELGLIAAVALMGAAVQFRVPVMLRVRLEQIAEEHKRRDEELEARAAERFPSIQHEQEEWENKHGHHRTSSSAPLIQDGSTPPTPSQHSRPLSSVFSLGGRGITPVAEYFTGTTGPTTADRASQNAGLLPAMDLGGNVKDKLPEKMISKIALVDEHPEIKQKRELLGEIREIRRSIDALSTVSYGTKGTRLSLGDIDATATREAALAASATMSSTVGGSGRERVKSMIAMPTPRPASSLAMPSGARPSSTPLDPKESYDWDTYVRERQLFVPPVGISAPIPTSTVPEALQRSLSNRIPQSEAVSAALEDRKRRESLFSLTTSTRLADTKENAESSHTSRLSHDLDSSVNAEGHTTRPAPAHTNTSHALHNAHVPITVLAPRKDTATTSVASPAPRVLTYEELTERHKSRMRALQKPLSKAAEEEATLAEARERWERSKAVEKEAMAKRHAEKAAEVDAKLKEREKVKRTSKSPDAGDPERRRSKRGSLSLDGLNSLTGSGRLSTAAKVEEWQKAQQSNPPEERRRSRREPDTSISKRP